MPADSLEWDGVLGYPRCVEAGHVRLVRVPVRLQAAREAFHLGSPSQPRCGGGNERIRHRIQTSRASNRKHHDRASVEAEVKICSSSTNIIRMLGTLRGWVLHGVRSQIKDQTQGERGGVSLHHIRQSPREREYTRAEEPYEGSTSTPRHASSLPCRSCRACPRRCGSRPFGEARRRSAERQSHGRRDARGICGEQDSDPSSIRALSVNWGVGWGLFDGISSMDEELTRSNLQLGWSTD